MTTAGRDEAVQVVTAWLEAHGQAELAAQLWAAAGVGARRAVAVPADVEHLIDQVDELLTELGHEELAMDVAVATEPAEERRERQDAAMILRDLFPALRYGRGQE